MGSDATLSIGLCGLCRLSIRVGVETPCHGCGRALCRRCQESELIYCRNCEAKVNKVPKEPVEQQKSTKVKGVTTVTPNLLRSAPERKLFVMRGERRVPCHYCGLMLNEKTVTVDHLTPISRPGGTNGKENLVAACVRCNGDKGNLTEAEYMQVLSDKAKAIHGGIQ